jgi:hypothetical protein
LRYIGRYRQVDAFGGNKGGNKVGCMKHSRRRLVTCRYPLDA